MHPIDSGIRIAIDMMLKWGFMNITPPYKKDFLYYPLSVDFENPFDTKGEDKSA